MPGTFRVVGLARTNFPFNAPLADMVLELSLACSSAPVLSGEMDPVTSRPALTVSLDLKVRMDVVALVEILASIANSQVEGGEEEEEQTAEAGQEEEEEGRQETEAADDAALLTGKPRIRAEETAPMPVSCSEDKILLARLLGISTKCNKIPFSGDNVLPDSIPSSTSPTSRPQAPRKWTCQAGRWHC